MSNFPTPAETARQVILNPEAFHSQPAVLATAWATLMEARGNTVNLLQMGPPAHRVVPDWVYPTNTQRSRISEKIQKVAIEKGYFQPPQSGVPA